MSEPDWDVFISHASEDTASVARPLAEILRRTGLRVWVDTHDIKLGDSLSDSINEALARSKYGLVILSSNFLTKQWPKRELAALLAIEMRHGKRILPVLHNLPFETLLREFPLMADRVCIATSSGLDTIASEVRRAMGLDEDVVDQTTLPPAPAIGANIGAYKIDARLGAGGSGVVYRVRSNAYPYPLALKLFHPLRAPYSHLLPLFSRGFRAVGSVHHPNVISVHDHGEFEFRGARHAYITMDLIDGVSLDVWCRQHTSPVERLRLALPLFRQLASALCAAHETSYVDELGFEVGAVLHGDVKPANVLVDREGVVRLIDFLQLDVQRLIDPQIRSPDANTSPLITTVMGTPGFMAPEQARHGIVTVATDIYGLGVTMAHALADGTTTNPVIDLLYKNLDIPNGFRKLVLAMLAAKPENRPARMRDVRNTLAMDFDGLEAD